MPDEMVNVRYMVDDVDTAVDFYTTHFGFEVLSSSAPAFADVRRGNLRLLLSGPTSSAGRPMPDGARPAPGGWNRIHLVCDDLDTEIARLGAGGVPFRNEVVTGPGGRQILVQDPAGNLIELFQPAGR
ncbi:MAG TPA: VOC family protein [Acidimicrobiia bacterium]|jgi:catechol 2,3-dioxygenase-like lactoylglutathione lyase family enzyme|nr:VOC family protein [Acidimicrobiia bacterium]